ncbi:MAG: hypothetical protein U5L72_06810 [Bacteroidales bacterium]|nr:hypothetical protein [Bacteroidales bacterium]
MSLFIRTATDWSGSRGFTFTMGHSGLLTVIVSSAVFFRFWLHLNSRMRLIFLISGVMYVSAAIGFEVVENLYDESFGKDIVYRLMQNVEEGIEMAAIVPFVSGLMGYLSESYRRLEFDFNPEAGLDE